MAHGEAAIHRPLCPQGRAALAIDTGTPCAQASRPFVLAATILASAMVFIDGSIVTLALPVLQERLGASFAALQWVVNAYALLLGGLILVGGSAGDRLGRRRVFIVGMAVFATASWLCALAPDVETLIAARALQGVGGALLVPQSLAIISAAFPAEIRGRAIGTWAAAAAITTALGPPLGGLLVDWLGWRSIFYINLPMAVTAAWLALAHVPESRDESASGALDWRGAGLVVVAFGLLTTGFTQLADAAGATNFALAALLLGSIALVLFVRVERSAHNPLMPLSLFASRAFSGANITTVFLYAALSGVMFLLPFELMARRGLSATAVGLSLLPFGLIIGSLSRAAGEWADNHGPRLPLIAGSTLVAMAATVLAVQRTDYWTGVLTPVVLMSLGMAIAVAPLTTAVMNAAPDAQSGAASGVNNAASRIAGLFAVAIVGATASAVFMAGLEAADMAVDGARFGTLPQAGDPSRGIVEAAFDHAYGVAMGLAASCAVIAALATYWLAPRAPVAA